MILGIILFRMCSADFNSSVPRTYILQRLQVWTSDLDKQIAGNSLWFSLQLGHDKTPLLSDLFMIILL
uniref:Uncharacterized protein n=1 Tax=Anguilla anguilla TaxID=7936 RepID=A0A0E9UPI3_ANGAN